MLDTNQPEITGLNREKLPRPTRYMPEVIEKSAQAAASEIIEQLDDTTCLASAEQLKSHLIEFSHYWGDGYELARELESNYGYLYSPNSHFVDCFNNLDSYRYQMLSEALKIWVKYRELSPDFKVGDMVKVTQKGPAFEKVGRVYAVDPEKMEYVIDTKNQKNGGYVINSENVSLADPSEYPDWANA